MFHKIHIPSLPEDVKLLVMKKQLMYRWFLAMEAAGTLPILVAWYLLSTEYIGSITVTALLILGSLMVHAYHKLKAIREGLAKGGFHYTGILTDKIVEDNTLDDDTIYFYFHFGENKLRVYGNLITGQNAAEVFHCIKSGTGSLEILVFPSIEHMVCKTERISNKEGLKFVSVPLTDKDVIFLKSQNNPRLDQELKWGKKEAARNPILYKEKTLISQTNFLDRETRRYGYCWVTAATGLKVTIEQFHHFSVGEIITINGFSSIGFYWYDDKDEQEQM